MELKTILVSANVPRNWYSINDKYWDDRYVIKDCACSGKKYWETFYSERGGINEYKSFVNEDILCRYFLYQLLHHKSSYNYLMDNYIFDYICANNNSKSLKNDVGNYNEIKEYDRYKRNIMYYMIDDVNDDIILRLLYNITKNDLFNEMLNISNPNFCDVNGCTYLHLACRNCNVEEVKILLKLGANPNNRDYNGDIPILSLHDITNPNSIIILDNMLQYGLDLNSRFNYVYGNRSLKEILHDNFGSLDKYADIIKKYY